MKKALLVAALLVAVSSVALAQGTAVPEGPQYTIFTKLFRGIGNVVTCPIEIPVSLFNVSADTDVAVGLTAGTIAGIAGGLERGVAGLVDIGTFIFPPYDRPLVTYEIGKSPAVQAAVAAFPKDF